MGHHYALTHRISEACASQGHHVVWATHHSFTTQSRDVPYSTYPLFSHTMYDRYDPKTKSKLPIDLDEILANDIFKLSKLLDLGSDDILYFHTGYGDLFRAYTNIISKSTSYNWPVTHICTPYDLTTMPAQDATVPLDPIFEALVNLPQTNMNLFLWAETDLLTEHFNNRFGAAFQCLALPPTGMDSKNEAPFEKNNLYVISYLGAAREEKGFHFLPDIVQQIWNSADRDSVKFFIQCTPQKIGYNSTITAALENLSRYPDSFVKLERSSLSETQYFGALSNTDLLLLLYNQDSYKIRGSGIAVESICAAVPYLTFTNTFCAHLISTGGGVVIDRVEGLAQVVQNCIRNKNILKISSEARKQTFLQNHSQVKYASLLTSGHLARTKSLNLLD